MSGFLCTNLLCILFTMGCSPKKTKYGTTFHKLSGSAKSPAARKQRALPHQKSLERGTIIANAATRYPVASRKGLTEPSIRNPAAAAQAMAERAISNALCGFFNFSPQRQPQQRLNRQLTQR